MIYWCPKCGVFGCGEKDNTVECLICQKSNNGCSNKMVNPPNKGIEIEYCRRCKPNCSVPKKASQLSDGGFIHILRNHNEKMKTAVFW